MLKTQKRNEISLDILETYTPWKDIYNQDFIQSKVNGPRPFGAHAGVDLHAKPGTSIYSSLSGEVIFAGNSFGSYGDCIIIKSQMKNGKDLYIIYGHLSPEMKVEQGEFIKKGMEIGSIGKLGDIKGRDPGDDNHHLHFEIITDIDRIEIHEGHTKRFENGVNKIGIKNSEYTENNSLLNGSGPIEEIYKYKKEFESWHVHNGRSYTILDPVYLPEEELQESLGFPLKVNCSLFPHFSGKGGYFGVSRNSLKSIPVIRPLDINEVIISQ